MARPVYSRQFCAVTFAAPATEVFILGDPSTYVLRDITWLLSSDPSSGATLEVKLAGLLIWVQSQPSDELQTGNQELRCVAPGPTTLSVEIAGALAAGNIIVSGYELTP